MSSQFSLPLDPAVVQSAGQQSGLTVSTVGTLGTPLSITDPSFIQANTALVKANAAFVQANTGTVLAQASFNYANTISAGAAVDGVARADIVILKNVNTTQNTAITATDGKMSSAYNQANTGTVLAQAAFNSANNVSPQIQPAFNQANTGTVLAQASYNQANTGTVLAQASYNQSNASFSGVNTAITIIQGINVTQNTAISSTDSKMSSAYNQANTGTVLAQAAFNYANTISSSGTSIDSFARTTANTGLVLAQAGFNKANTAITTSGGSISGSLVVTANNLNVYSGNSTSDMFQANFVAGNASYLRMYGYRWADGSSWTTASTRIQQRIDATDMSYIEFNPPNGNYGMAFGSGVTESVRILQSGSVGIKTTNPTVALEVNGNIKANIVFISDSVGIKTTTPNYALEVNGIAKANAAILNGIDTMTYVQNAFNTANNKVASITGTANQINTTGGTTPTLSLPQSIHTSASVQFGSFGVGTAASGTTGEIRATNEVTAYFSSDERLKENIEQIDAALYKLRKVRGVMFDWKDEVIEKRGGEDKYFVRKHDTGVIAQEIEQVLPEVVAVREDGYKAVRYEKLAGLIIQAINELADEVDEIKKRLN